MAASSHSNPPGTRAKSSASRRPVTLPQELLDMILDHCQAYTLRACSLVAHSLLHSSQKRLFRKIDLEPSAHWYRPNPSFVKFWCLLSAAPHLGANVQSLSLNLSREFEGRALSEYTDILPHILPLLDRLKDLSIHIGRPIRDGWEDFPSVLKQSIETALAAPSLHTVRMYRISFTTMTELASLLRCCQHARAVSLFSVDVSSTHALDDDTVEPPFPLEFHSLTLYALSPSLVHALRGLEWSALKYLHVTLSHETEEPSAQVLLEAMENLESLHVCFEHSPATASKITLHNLRRIRTFEMTISLVDLSQSLTLHNPLLSVRKILMSAGNVGSIERVLLNVHVDSTADNLIECLCHAELDSIVDGPEMCSLQEVRLAFDESQFRECLGGLQDSVIESCFPLLSTRGMLTVELTSLTAPYMLLYEY